MTNHEIILLKDKLKAEIIETHISWILLAEDKAYKIKKPVKNSFLDFSTLALRKFYCEEEFRLNKELAPEIYEAVVPLSKTDKVIEIGDIKGNAIEYALQMKRMDERRQLFILLKKNQVRKDELIEFAGSIADFHKRQDPLPYEKLVSERIKEFDDILNYTDLFRNSYGEKALENLINCTKIAVIYVRHNEELFSERLLNGFVRDLHGDLHSQNIFLLDRPVLFDRIEFNRSFRITDVLHELAFLCLDFDFFNRRNQAEFLLNTYSELMNWEIGKTELSLFLYYKSYCANVRAKVNVLVNKSDPEIASRYLNLMFDYVRNLPYLS
jgi:aminoglycoside phosphotransferase family enzyme